MLEPLSVKTLGGSSAQISPFEYTLPPEAAEINCHTTDVFLFRKTQVQAHIINISEPLRTLNIARYY
jgi:hypothetical protein